MGEGHNFLVKLFLSLVALTPVNNDRSLKHTHLEIVSSESVPEKIVFSFCRVNE